MSTNSAVSDSCWQSTLDPEAGDPPRPVDESSFKAAMRRLASGVAVVTSSDGEVSNGMTATAICSWPSSTEYVARNQQREVC